MMNATVEKLVKAVEERMVLKGYAVSLTENKKNNVGIKPGIIIRKQGDSTGVVVYVDVCVLNIEAGILSVDKAADMIAERIEDEEVATGYSEAKNFAKMIRSKKSILENVRYSLVNKKWNEAELNSYPHKEYLDLAVVYEVRNKNASMGLKITNDIMQNSGITFEELDEAANNNGDSYVAQDMLGMMVSMMPFGEEEIEEMRKAQANGPQMYVLTNVQKVKGASALLYPELIEDVAQKENSDLIVIPSSIHEILMVKASGMDKNDISQIVQEANSQQVDEQERLSDHAYFYKRGSLQITL